MDRCRRAMLLGDLALSREEIFQVFRVDHGKRSDYGKGRSSPLSPKGARDELGYLGSDHVDQAVGGSVVARHPAPRPGVRAGSPGKLLAQLDAPLVEGLMSQIDALDEDLVLVERDQRAQAIGVELAVQDRVGRPVAARTPCAAPALPAPRPTAPASPARPAPRPRSCRASAPRSGRGSWPAALGGGRRAGSGSSPAAMKSAGISWVPWWINW